VQRILIAMAIQILGCSIPALGKQQSGIYQGERSSEVPLGPVPGGWALVATADFNSDGHPDYLLYNPTSRQTAIWYLNNNVYVSAAYGPTLPPGWSLVAP
jgi:hypothetical protein